VSLPGRRSGRYTEHVTGTVEQINISRGGVPKLSVPLGQVGTLGLAGDVQAHPHIHGGPRQALLLICAEVIDRLKEEGFPVYYGALGENITTRGLDHREFRLGQQFRIGAEVWIEITKVRGPCSQLDVYGVGEIQKAIHDKQVKAGDPSSPRWAMSGVYASVIRAGRIQPGDPITLVAIAA
jgi:MOSC domain-containing protein YiiM